MDTLIFLLLASYGLTFGIMNEKVPFLGKTLRKIPILKDEDGDAFFTRMLVCSYCTGFHTGWAVWLAHSAGEESLSLSVASLVGVLCFAFASSAFCYMMDTAVQWLEG